MDLITSSVYGPKASTAEAADQSANRRKTRLQRATDRANKWREEKLAGDLAFARSQR